MKHRAAILSFAAAALAAGTLVAADAPKFDALTDWNKNPKLTFADGVFTVTGQRVEVVSRPFAIDPAKTYKFSMEVRRTPGSGEGTCYVGNWSISEKNVRMLPQHVMAAPGTDSTLAVDAQKGAKEIVIKRPAKWRDDFKKVHWGVVFHAKADLSDLPNSTYNDLVSAEADGDNLKLTLRYPLRENYPAGTVTRFHSSGNGMYGGWCNKVVPEEWTTVTWKVGGIASTGNSARQWWHGTIQGAVRIIANYETASSLEFRNVRVTEVPKP